MSDDLSKAILTAVRPGDPASREGGPAVPLGPCFSGVHPDRVVPALTIQFPTQPWVSFDYHLRGLGCSCTATQIVLEFRDADYRKRVVIEGRGLQAVYPLIVSSRLEWIKPIAKDRDFIEDGKPVVTGVTVTDVTPK